MSRTFDIPETIPLSKVLAFLSADLGLPVNELQQLHVGLDAVYVELLATDEKGRPYMETNGGIAMHRISIRLDREA